MLNENQLSRFKELFESKLKDPLLKNKELIVEKGHEARISIEKRK